MHVTYTTRDRTSRSVAIPWCGATLAGDLHVPDCASGLVLVAHGSGSSRFSPRNRFVADRIAGAGLGTLLFDLLTPDEESVDRYTAHMRSDVELLARRVVAATAWAVGQPATRDLRIGYFGASTGAAAALLAAAQIPEAVGAVVSRGGRPDLAARALSRVVAPTLLVVGGSDYAVAELNREAYRQLECERQLVVVPRATHLFDEPGALEAVARLTTNWFETHLGSPR
jgi:putative phosphoribosyl transferase